MRKAGVLLVLACMFVAVAAEANCGKCEKKKGEAKPEAKRCRHHGDWKKFDKDGDGKLSEEERAAAKEAWELKKYDKDGNGKLSKKEKAAAEKAKKEFMAKYDKDGDGELSKAERKAMRKSGMRRSKHGRKKECKCGKGKKDDV